MVSWLSAKKGESSPERHNELLNNKTNFQKWGNEYKHNDNAQSRTNDVIKISLSRGIKYTPIDIRGGG